MPAVAHSHEGTFERAAINRASDLNKTTGAKELHGAGPDHISPPALMALLQLTGTATLQNWTCFASLNFSTGLAIGGAFILSDTINDVVIVAVPSGATTFNIAYQVGSSASVCAGDHGTGTLTIQ